MKYLLTLLLIIGICVFPFAQKVDFTLKDAVLKQRSDFAPKSVNGLQWVAGSNKISMTKDDGSQMLFLNTENWKKNESISVDVLNDNLGLDMKRFPKANWLDENTFYFKNKNAFYKYNLADNAGDLLLDIGKPVANSDYHVGSNSLAYTEGNNLFMITKDKKDIAITNYANPNIVCGQAIARHEFGIRKGTFWSSSGAKLAYYLKDESDVADYPLLDNTTVPGTLMNIKYPMAGQKSEYAKIAVYDVEKGSTVVLQVEGPKDQYLTNLTWDPNERYVYVAVLNRDQNHMWLNKYDVGSGELVKTLFEEQHDKYVEPEHALWFLPNSSKEFLWFSERDGFMHLYRYNTQGKLLNQVTKGRFVVEKILGLDKSGKNVIVSGTDKTGLNRYAYSASLKSKKTSRISKQEGVHSLKLSPKGDLLIDVFSNVNTPRIINVIDVKGKTKHNIFIANNPLAGYNISLPIIKTIEGENKLPLHTRMIKPSDFDASKKYPVLVYVYGGPHAQMVTNSWMARAPLWMYYMAEQGYIVFTLDNRGSAGRGFEFENVIHRNLGELEMIDQLIGVAYLKSLPYVDSEKMAVHGWSYGGFMTTSLMLRHPGVFKVGVAGGPVTDWNYYEVMYGERYMDRPEENMEGYERSRLMNHVEYLEGDLLLIHGTVDNVVVMQHNLSLIQAFVDEGIQVDFFAYPMHPHNVRGKDRVHLMEKVLNYVQDNLKD